MTNEREKSANYSFSAACSLGAEQFGEGGMLMHFCNSFARISEDTDICIIFTNIYINVKVGGS